MMPVSPLPIVILLPLFFGALLCLAAGLLKRFLVSPLAIIAQLAFAGTTVLAAKLVLHWGPQRYELAAWPPPIGIEFNLDRISAFVLVVIAWVSLPTFFYARRWVRERLPEREGTFFALALILEFGLAGMVITGDLFNFYVFLEIASLAAYALMAIGDARAPLSAYRYLLAGSIGGSLYLLGLGYLYFLTGSLNMADVAIRLGASGNSPAVLLSLVLIASGLGLKMALFPMHSWLPDAYTHASAVATALIAPIMTKVSAYALIRIFYFVYSYHQPVQILSDNLPTVIAWLSCGGIIVGSLMAMAQSDLKRVLAYSSISQISYIGLGIGIGTPLAVSAALLHVLNHALMKSCLFLSSGSIEWQRGKTRLDDIAGIGHSLPATGAALTVAALAMVGLPPTVGFFSKWYLIQASLEQDQWYFAAVILVSSLATAVYMFRVIEKIYTQGVPASLAHTLQKKIPLVFGGASSVLAAAVLVLGFFSPFLIRHLLQGFWGHG